MCRATWLCFVCWLSFFWHQPYIVRQCEVTRAFAKKEALFAIGRQQSESGLTLGGSSGDFGGDRNRKRTNINLPGSTCESAKRVDLLLQVQYACAT